MTIVAGKIIIKSDTADDSKIQNAQKVSGTGRNIKDLIEDLKNPKPVEKELKPEVPKPVASTPKNTNGFTIDKCAHRCVAKHSNVNTSTCSW